MHTKPELTSPAAQAATAEAETWIDLAVEWSAESHFHVWDDIPGSELDVVRLYDPAKDLHRRMSKWSYPVGMLDFSDLARFAAGLAQAEADAWETDRAHVATQAYAERRFLVADRIMPWAVPWFDAIVRAHPEESDGAAAAKATLLAIGDKMRPAPALSGSEGLVVPGFDGFGPLAPDAPSYEFLLSLWSGSVISLADLSTARHGRVERRLIEPTWLTDSDTTRAFSNHYDQAALRWESVAVDHPGTAQLWLDLASRARQTARLLLA